MSLRASQLPVVDLLGVKVHAVTLSESLRIADELIQTKSSHQHVVVNAAKVVQAYSDPELRETINGCALINADGQSVVWACRLLGRGVPERVAGIDFMIALWGLAAERGYRVYMLGASRRVLHTVILRAEERGVNVVGAHDGYWTSDEEEGIVAEVRDLRPDILFVAIPSPRKEKFVSARLAELNVPLVVGVGGSFDVVAGEKKRAPVWMQRWGFEWLYRLYQEPRRMFRRYAVGNTKFVALVLRQWLREVSVGRRRRTNVVFGNRIGGGRRPN